MSPEGDTQHCQAVGRGGRRTGKGILQISFVILLEILQQFIMLVVEMAKRQRHCGITTFRRQSSETIVKSRKRFFPAQLV